MQLQEPMFLFYQNKQKDVTIFKINISFEYHFLPENVLCGWKLSYKGKLRR